MISRVEDWPERLIAWVDRARTRTFQYGTWDCCLAAAEWVREATGLDFAEEYRGYKTEAGAYRKMKAIAEGGVVEVVTRALGEPLASPKLAQRGDIVAVETEYGPALGVHLGESIAVVTPSGLGFLRARAAEIAWRV